MANYPLVLLSTPVSSGYYMIVSGGVYEFAVPSGGSPAIDVMHNLDGESFQISVFNSDNEYIYPEDIKISNKDYITLTFSTSSLPISGYAVIKKTSNIGYGTTYTFHHAHLGYGTSGQRYNPTLSNSLENQYPETYTILDRDVDEDDTHYYITINIDENIDYSIDADNDRYGIREVGIFNDSDEILFYTYCDLIEKPRGVSLKLYYKIEKKL